MQEVTGDVDNLFKFMLAGQDFTFETFRVFEGQLPGDAEACEGWLITGSLTSVLEDLDWIAPLEDLVREAVRLSRPVVGVDFGHLLVAQALGGTVEEIKSGPIIGRKMYDFGGVKLPLNAWHTDQVTSPPEGVQLICGNADCPHAAIAYGNRALTFQFHPEYGPDAMEGLVHYAPEGSLTDEQIQEVMLDLGEPTANEVIADQIADFMRLPR